MMHSRFGEMRDGLAVRVLAHSDSREALAWNSSLLLVRSTSYGDFTAFLPFVAEAMTRIGNGGVSLLLLSRHGRIGEALLGERSGIPIVTFDSSDLAGFPRELLRAGWQTRRLDYGQVLFCGPPIDRPTWRLKRWLLTRSLVGGRRPIRGFGFSPPVLKPDEAERQGPQSVVNQALMPYAQLNLVPTIDRNAVLAIVGLTTVERKRAVDVAPPRLRTVGVCVGSRLARKRWPHARFAELVNRLLNDQTLAIVFLGGAEDLPAIHAVIRDVRATARVRVAAGVLSLRETIALASRLSLCVGNDGATGHLCAIGGCPVVSIFCNWEPAGIWEPILAPASRSIRPVQSFARAQGDYGIGTLPVDAVESASAELLNGAGGHDVIEVGAQQVLRRRHLAGFPL